MVNSDKRLIKKSIMQIIDELPDFPDQRLRPVHINYTYKINQTPTQRPSSFADDDIFFPAPF